MYTILVPYDFSDESVNALTHAESIARARNARLVLLHVVRENTPEILHEAVGANAAAGESPALTHVREVRHQLEHLSGVQLIDDIVDDILVKLATEDLPVDAHITGVRADLLVMGSQGFHASEELFVSSTTETVASRSFSPVIVVKKDTEVRPVNRIAYANSLEHDNNPKVTRLVNFVKGTDVHVHVVNVVDEGYRETNDLRKRMAAIGATIQPMRDRQHVDIVRSSDVRNALVSYIEEQDIDMLVMHAHHLISPSRFFHKGLVEPLVNKMSRPVMLLNHD